MIGLENHICIIFLVKSPPNGRSSGRAGAAAARLHRWPHAAVLRQAPHGVSAAERRRYG